ncbi:MAG: hypothetical protein R2711_12255 [Acidimicrobiales bacterium]
MAQQFFSEYQLRQYAQDNAAILAPYGPDEATRIATVNRIFDEKVATLRATWFCGLSPAQRHGVKTKDGFLYFQVSRPLAGMTNREREYLRRRAAQRRQCGRVRVGSPVEGVAALGRRRAPWPEGSSGCRPPPASPASAPRSPRRTRRWGERGCSSGCRTTRAPTRRSRRSSRTSSASPTCPTLRPEYRSMVAELIARLSPAGGNGWLRSSQTAGTVFGPDGDHLHIGSFDDGTPLTYRGDGSMITIAPPGSGKTQANVFPTS